MLYIRLKESKGGEEGKRVWVEDIPFNPYLESYVLKDFFFVLKKKRNSLLKVYLKKKGN